MLSLLVPIVHPQFVPLQCRVCMIAWIIYLQQGGEKGGHMFLGVSTQGSDWYDDFQNIAFHLPLWDNIRGNIRRRPTLTFLVWIVIILTKTWLLSKRAQIVLFIYMSNMSNKQMAQSDTKHSNIGEKLLTTTFLFFVQNHQFEPFATLQISGLYHLKFCPLGEMYDYW